MLCTFMQSEMKFLGHIVRPQGLHPKKAFVVQEWLVHEDFGQFAVFLGLGKLFETLVIG